MSRIGKKIVNVPDGVDVNLSGQLVAVKGPKGELSATLSNLVSVSQDDNCLSVKPVEDTQTARSF